MASVIFYGAGRNACEKFGTWVNQGLKPACFVDADVKKHHTEFKSFRYLKQSKRTRIMNCIVRRLRQACLK